MAKAKKTQKKAKGGKNKKFEEVETEVETPETEVAIADEELLEGDDYASVVDELADELSLGDEDDLPPDDEDAVAMAADFDDDKLVAEVHKSEGGDSESEDLDADEVPPPEPLPAVAIDTDEEFDVLPSMEGISILREKELNDVLNDVKRRSEANGGYITYEELNQILPQNIVDEIQSERYLKILEALGVQVIREEDVKRWLEAKAERQIDAKARAQEMIEDPIRMYLHQMGQVQLLTKDEEISICQTIETSEVKTRDMFNRFLFAPAMYARQLDILEGQGERFDRIVTDRFDEKRDDYMSMIPAFRKQIKDVEKRMTEASAKYLNTIANRDASPASVRGKTAQSSSTCS